MVNDLKELMRENVAAPPPDHLDIATVVVAGRRRVRARRTTLASGVAALAVAAVIGRSRRLAGRRRRRQDRRGPPQPDAPTLHLADARQAVAGRDYRVLASYTNENLDQTTGSTSTGSPTTA